MVSKRKEYRMIQTTIRIPTELHTKLKELAKKRGLTVNALIIQALWELQEKRLKELKNKIWAVLERD